ncbi:MAG: hypothetical protein ACXWQO_05160 [Bdellovibrionota bacterium]
MQSKNPLSTGSIIKRISAINPRLNVQQITLIIRSSIEKGTGDAFAGSGDEINEEKAFAFARETLKPR